MRSRKHTAFRVPNVACNSAHAVLAVELFEILPELGYTVVVTWSSGMIGASTGFGLVRFHTMRAR